MFRWLAGFYLYNCPRLIFSSDIGRVVIDSKIACAYAPRYQKSWGDNTNRECKQACQEAPLHENAGEGGQVIRDGESFARYGAMWWPAVGSFYLAQFAGKIGTVPKTGGLVHPSIASLRSE